MIFLGFFFVGWGGDAAAGQQQLLLLRSNCLLVLDGQLSQEKKPPQTTAELDVVSKLFGGDDAATASIKYSLKNITAVVWCWNS